MALNAGIEVELPAPACYREGLKQALAAGERIELRGFGVFSVRARKTGIGRNPRTGTEVSIAPGKAVRFKPGKELHALESGGAPRT